jgi:cell division protein ZapA
LEEWDMKNTINVNIAGVELRLISGENEEYTRRVAAHVDTKVGEVLKSGSVSIVEAAILSAINISDEYYKALETAENLRTQLRDYLEDGSRMKSEIADLKRELAKLGK